jgi:hypothetical protein
MDFVRPRASTSVGCRLRPALSLLDVSMVDHENQQADNNDKCERN